MAQPPPRLSIALSDRHRVERELGAGGMATGYHAQDPNGRFHSPSDNRQSDIWVINAAHR